MPEDAPRSRGEKRDLPIGIFDSGVGGLTVLAALRARLPNERFRYLGDTARLPYGTKSGATIVRYALRATAKLVERRVKLLVVACNTATAAALPDIKSAYPDLPVIGVVEPGAAAACKASRNGKILVLGTESTIRGQAYVRAIKAIRPEADVAGIACSLFVSLAEEGWVTGPVAEAIAARYLAAYVPPSCEPHNAETGFSSKRPDCVVLGCTHFPPLAPAIRAVLGKNVRLVDSADTTAAAVTEKLRRLDLLRAVSGQDEKARQRRDAEGLSLLTTDAPERFARVGGLFLGMPFDASLVELVAL